MKSTEDEDLRDFVDVLEGGLLDQKHLGNRDFMFCMSAYMSRNDMLHKLWQRGDYQRLLSDPRYVTGIAVLFHCSTDFFASIARRLQDSLTRDPNITMRTMQEVCKVTDLEVLAKTARSLTEVLVADRTSAMALVTAKQEFLSDNAEQPTTQGTSASARSDSETSNQYNAMQRQMPSNSSHESSENQEENVAYPNSMTTAPIAQIIRPPAIGQNSSCLNARTSGSSSNTSLAIGRGRPAPDPNDPSRTHK